jgi:hypothetical protein
LLFGGAPFFFCDPAALCGNSSFRKPATSGRYGLLPSVVGEMVMSAILSSLFVFVLLLAIDLVTAPRAC